MSFTSIDYSKRIFDFTWIGISCVRRNTTEYKNSIDEAGNWRGSMYSCCLMANYHEWWGQSIPTASTNRMIQETWSVVRLRILAIWSDRLLLICKEAENHLLPIGVPWVFVVALQQKRNIVLCTTHSSDIYAQWVSSLLFRTAKRESKSLRNICWSFCLH